MKPARIVCLVVADESGTHSCIGGEELTERIRQTLHAYEFTAKGIEAVMQVILGNDEVPIRFEEEGVAEKMESGKREHTTLEAPGASM